MGTDAFRGQVAIITGASAGIGKALAIELAGGGAKVSVAARRGELLDDVVSSCRSSGADALAIKTDLTDEAQCKALVEKTIQAFGKLDMLICNAAIAATALLDEFPSLDLFRQTMDVNFYGAVNCAYYATPHLKQSKGRLVFISSLGGKVALPYNTPYCSSKYALHGFSEALRMELSKSGVSVTVVCPWWVATEFHTAQLDKNGMPRGSERGKDMYTSKTMSAERCAEIILDAANKRRREVLMGPGKLAVWLKVLAPGLLDWLVIKAFLEPVIRRASEARLQREKSISS